MRPIKWAPSIVSADLGRLNEQLAECEAAGAEYIHIDVMDGQFVVPITIGTPIVEAIRKATRLVLDVHLMIVQPEKQVGAFVDAGGDIINVHVEAATHPHRIAQDVHARGKKAGICLNPGTPVTAIEQLLPEIDQVMVMAVNPGYSGQKFIEAALPKVERVRKLIDTQGLSVEIEVDGGVKVDTAGRCALAGADVLVSASGLFNDHGTVAENMRRLQDAVASAG